MTTAHHVKIKEKTSKRFNKWSGKYDRSVLQRLVFRDSHSVFLREIKPYSEDNSLCVLDVGCGTGEFILKMLRNVDDIELHGVDLSPDMIKIASSKLENKNVQLKLGDVEDLPYEDETFDVVTCSHSFHHYPNQKKAVSEMCRVLKKNGKLMIVDGSRDKILGKVIFGLFITRLEKDVYHILSKELEEIFNINGFKNIIQSIFNPFIPLLFTQGTKKE